MHWNHIADGETGVALAGLPASPAPPHLAGKVIRFPLELRAAAIALEDCEEADCWESVGFLAVRLVTRWNDVRVHCETMAPE